MPPSSRHAEPGGAVAQSSGGVVHCPRTQLSPAKRHWLLQLPQLLISVEVSTQAPPQQSPVSVAERAHGVNEIAPHAVGVASGVVTIIESVAASVGAELSRPGGGMRASTDRKTSRATGASELVCPESTLLFASGPTAASGRLEASAPHADTRNERPDRQATMRRSIRDTFMTIGCVAARRHSMFRTGEYHCAQLRVGAARLDGRRLLPPVTSPWTMPGRRCRRSSLRVRTPSRSSTNHWHRRRASSQRSTLPRCTTGPRRTPCRTTRSCPSRSRCPRRLRRSR